MAKIGILTFFKVINYGAVLQAFALYKWLNKNTNSDVEIINYTHEVFRDKVSNKIFIKSRGFKNNLKHFIKFFLLSKGKIKSKKFNNFVKENFKLSDEVLDVSLIANNYNCIIIGSDQVWNPEYTNYKLDKNFLLCDSAFDCVKKISFASSAGSFVFQGDLKHELAKSLSKFSAISVRENSLKQQFVEFGYTIKEVLDPTFLFDKNEWNELFDLYDEDLAKENYLLLYTFDNDYNCYEVSNYLKNEFGYKFYSITSKLFKHPSVDKQLDNLSPKEFLKYFFNAKYIVTNSFHGTCFSINFHKQFYSIRKGNNPARVEDLLKKFFLTDRLIRSVADVELKSKIESYNDLLESERKNSTIILQESIEKL